MENYPHLFSNFILAGLRLRNRIVRAPMFTGFSEADGYVSPLMLDYYGDVARGGAAMVIVANAVVDPLGSLGPYSLRIDHDRYLLGLGDLAQAIKGQGAVAAIQISHSGRFGAGKKRMAPSRVSMRDMNPLGFYRRVLAPMSLRDRIRFLRHHGWQAAVRPHQMSREEIGEVVDSFAAAAIRAKKAGFQVVEIHGGTGYLPVQFLSPLTNRRSDEYGGELENRMRFPLELVHSVRDAVRAHFPVGYRFQADEKLKGGFTLEEAKVLSARLAREGVAYFSVTGGRYEFLLESGGQPEAARTRDLAELSGRISGVVSHPVIATGGISTPAGAERVLASGQADLVGLARPLLADPMWPEKAARGREDEILLCERDCLECFRRIIAARPAICPRWEESRSQRYLALLNPPRPVNPA